MQLKREFILTILAPSLIFLSGFLTYIIHHDYGIFTREVILSLTLIGLAGILVGIPLAIAGPTRLRAFGFAALLFIFFDIQFSLVNTIYDYLATESDVLQRYALVIVALFVAQLIILGLHKHIATIITTVFTVTILTTIALPIQKVSYGAQPVAALNAPEPDLPPMIHLVLDEHIGIEGIPLDIEGGIELKDLLMEFYERWGFRLYGRAYSKYLMTYDSMTNLLNGQTSAVGASLAAVTYQQGKIGWKPVQNDYFSRFSDAGYRIHVYQTEYLDFCQGFKGNIEHCYLYSYSSPRLIRELNLPVADKTKLILGGYFFGTVVFRIIQDGYNRVHGLFPENLLPAWERRNYDLYSLGVPAVIAQLKQDISTNPGGRLFFAHLLLPHAPYIWEADCQTRDNSATWLSRRLDHQDLLTRSDPQYREAAYKYYFQQTVCTILLLDDLFETLEKDGLLEDATIIIHGDHGSRITLTDPVTPMSEYVTDRDLIDGFSTLFAIRSETTEPGYDSQYRDIQSLFGELVLDQPAAADDRKVFLLTGPRTRMTPLDAVSLPEF